MNESIRKAVKERLKEKESSQNKLAERLGMKPTSISRMLSDSARSGEVTRNWQRIFDDLGLNLIVVPNEELTKSTDN